MNVIIAIIINIHGMIQGVGLQIEQREEVCSECDQLGSSDNIAIEVCVLGQDHVVGDVDESLPDVIHAYGVIFDSQYQPVREWMVGFFW